MSDAGDIGVVGAERLLADREGALVERLGLGVAAFGDIQRSQVVERRSDIGVVGAQRLLADGERALSKRDRLSVLAFTIELEDPCVERIGVVALLRHGRWSENESPRHHYPRHEPGEMRHAMPLPQSEDADPLTMTRGRDASKARRAFAVTVATSAQLELLTVCTNPMHIGSAPACIARQKRQQLQGFCVL